MLDGDIDGEVVMDELADELVDPLGEDVIELLFVAEEEGDIVEEIDVDPVDETLDVPLELDETLELIVVVIVEDGD